MHNPYFLEKSMGETHPVRDDERRCPVCVPARRSVRPAQAAIWTLLLNKVAGKRIGSVRPAPHVADSVTRANGG